MHLEWCLLKFTGVCTIFLLVRWALQVGVSLHKCYSLLFLLDSYNVIARCLSKLCCNTITLACSFKISLYSNTVCQFFNISLFIVLYSESIWISSICCIVLRFMILHSSRSDKFNGLLFVRSLILEVSVLGQNTKHYSSWFFNIIWLFDLTSHYGLIKMVLFKIQNRIILNYYLLVN